MRSHLSTAVLYSAFALTGFGTALLGATLPSVLAHWSLDDRSGGLLFLLMFLGSSLGALLSRGRSAHSTARGLVVLAPTCFALATATGRGTFPLCFLYGLGLGITITSINRLRSQRRAKTRVSEMNRLNLVWAAGAFASPSVGNGIIHQKSVAILFVALGSAFLFFLVWALAVEIHDKVNIEAATPSSVGGSHRLPLILMAATMLATGLESSTGAWIATAAERLRSGFAAPVAAGSVFWFGLLASRAVYSTRKIQQVPERLLLRISICTAALGCLFLIVSQHSAILLLAALLIGLGIGPVYPLLLAAVIPNVAGNTIFLVAGLGGATFPWLTGAVSTHAGSLRVGMAVPAAAGLTLFALLLRISPAFESIENGGIGEVRRVESK